ncbi:MAG: endo-1,4-beta-xylanase [Kiritimatiellales bacterium]
MMRNNIMKKLNYVVWLLLFSGLLLKSWGADVAGDSQEAKYKALPAGRPLRDAPLELSDFKAKGVNEGRLKITRVPAQGIPVDHAYRLETLSDNVHTYDAQVSIRTEIPLEKDEKCLLSFYARAVTDGKPLIEPLFEQDGSPWFKSILLDIPISGEWQHFFVPFTVNPPWGSPGYAAGEAHLAFNLGFSPQVIEVAGVECRTFGTEIARRLFPQSGQDYVGREANAPWREAALKRIDQVRKADLTVRVLDPDGKPVPDAALSIDMTRHAFPFGCDIDTHFLYDTPDGSDKERYRREFAANFNLAVFDGATKIRAWGKKEKQEQVFKTLDWLDSQGIAARGHVLVWPSFKNSPWRGDSARIAYYKDHPDELRKALDDHIRDILIATKGRMVNWDAINEPYANHDFMDICGQQVMLEWFNLAHELASEVPLFVNENGILRNSVLDDAGKRKSLEKVIQYLQDHGAPLGGIGMQSHFRNVPRPPEQVLATLDEFSRFKLPIWITEFDQDCWDEDLQGAYLRDFLIAVFSHSQVQGFLMWGFWDGCHWKNNAPLFRQDWTLKPSGRAYRDLVFRDWWTREKGHTDAQGVFTSRVFKGEYEVTCQVGDHQETQTLAVDKDGALTFHLSR